MTNIFIYLALVVPSINTIFSLVGGSCSAFCCFVVPAMIALKLGGRSKTVTFFTWMMLIVGAVAGVLSTGYAVYNNFIAPTPQPDVCHDVSR